ncbi:MAG TPA: tryptophan-rich sensory protein [Pirellulales bacterium]
MPDWMPWYNDLAKPAWTPAPAIIGLIWTILYPVRKCRIWSGSRWLRCFNCRSRP